MAFCRVDTITSIGLTLAFSTTTTTMKNDDESKLCFEEMNKRFKELNQFSLT
jgi:hypothetical protein